MKENIKRLKDTATALQEDFKEARSLRNSSSFTQDDKAFFMCRCKQAEGIISASKNILENEKFLKKGE